MQEWTDDLEQLEKNHRHFSHLYGLYPGNVLSMRKTPEFVSPVKAVLEQRGDGGAGWSRAWKVALWSRLRDGNRSEKVLKEYWKEQSYPQLLAKCFTPLQVDGTLGMTAGISEMLLQSHEGALDFLPALPATWSEGRISGIRARGGFEVSFEWKQNKLKSAQIISHAGEACRIFLTTQKMQIISNGKKISFKAAGDKIEFSTQKGQTYSLLFN